MGLPHRRTARRQRPRAGPGGREEGPVDAAFWSERGWFDADWFNDRPVPKVANRIAAAVEKKIRTGIEKGSAAPYTQLRRRR